MNSRPLSPPLQTAETLRWELERLRLEASSELTKSWKEFETLFREKAEQDVVVESLQARCVSLQSMLDLLSTPQVSNTTFLQSCTQNGHLPRNSTHRGGTRPTRSLSPYRLASTIVVNPTYLNLTRESAGEDTKWLEDLSDNEEEEIESPEILRLSASSFDLSLSLSKMFSTKSFFSVTSDKSNDTNDLTSSNDNFERKVDVLQREKLDLIMEYERKIKNREESITTLEHALAVKEQTITALRNALERDQLAQKNLSNEMRLPVDA